MHVEPDIKTGLMSWSSSALVWLNFSIIIDQILIWEAWTAESNLRRIKHASC